MPSAQSTSIEIQERDLHLLRGLFESRLMTLGHAAVLHFDGKAEATKKRVQKLKAAGVIGDRPRRHREPSVLFLMRKGFDLLLERGYLSDYPHQTFSEIEGRARVSDLTLRHELAVMDVKAAVCAAISATAEYHVVEFSTWPALFQFSAAPEPHAPEVQIKADAYIRVRERDEAGQQFEHTFFLEVDRSTETLKTLASKAACYVSYYRCGGLAVRHGSSPAEFKDFPFRVLVVLQNAERRNNLTERLLLRHPPILSQVWMTTMREVVETPLGAIWVRPKDYRTVTEGTPYEPKYSPRAKGYRRQAEREDLVERAVLKHALLESGPH